MKTLKETLELANELAIRSTDTHGTCFMSFSGHINNLSIDIYPLGWHRKELVDKYCVYNGYLNTDTEINLAYFSILKELEKRK